MLKSARRTTIAPTCFDEKPDYLIIGDKYVRVMTFKGYPEMYIEGLLAPLVTSNQFDIDIYTEQSDMNIQTALKSEMNDIEDKMHHTSDPTEYSTLNAKYGTLKQFIDESVNRKSRTLNCITQIYVKAETKEQLDKLTKDVRDKVATSSMGISLTNIKYIQQFLYKKNSTLWVNDGLTSDQRFLDGQLMSTNSFAGLWPWIFDTLEDEDGTLIGRELINGGKIIFDQFFYKNNPDLAKLTNRPNGNMIVIGRTGTGKTTVMGLLIMGHIINGRRIIWIDPENKNERLCNYIGGNYISIGKDNHIINIFDLKPISTDSDEMESVEVMYDTAKAISNVIEDIKITFKLLWPEISEDALSMIAEITVKTYESVGIRTDKTFDKYSYADYPTFTNFSSELQDTLEVCSKNIDKYQLQVKALRELEMKCKALTGFGNFPGEYSHFFNGKTTISEDALESSGMIAIGTKHLFSVSDNLKNALVRIIFQYAWSLCMKDDKQQCVFVNDEQHMFVGDKKIANIVSIFQRRARKYNTVTLFGTQEVVEYTNPEIIADGKGIFDNAIYHLYMNLTKDGVNDLSKLMSLNDGEKERLQTLPPHCGIFLVGNNHIPIEVLATPDELKLMP